MRRALTIGVAIVVLAACSLEGAGHADVRRGDDAGRAAVDLLASAVESSMDGAEMPDGGYVAFGIREPDGRLGRNLVVFDRDGEPALAFELPERLWTRSSIVVGDHLYVVGTACEGVPTIDDVGNEQCPPDTPRSIRVDLRTGESSDLEMPGLEGGPARPALHRAGDTLLAIVGSPNGAGEGAAWAYTEGSWSPVEPPPGVVCQAGDVVISHTTTPVTPPDPGDPNMVDERATTTPSASVYEPDTGTWAPAVTGPTIEVPAMIGTGTACSAGALTLLARERSDAPGRPGIDLTAVSFDAAERRWTEPTELGTFPPATFPLPGPYGAKVLLDGGSTWHAYDPATGAVDPFTPPPTLDRSPFNANGPHLWTYHPGVNTSALTVTRVPA